MKMSKLICTIVLLVTASAYFHAQTGRTKFETAEKLFKEENFVGALPIYMNLLKQDSTNATLNFKAGICYLKSRSQKNKSVALLNKALLPTKSCYYYGTKIETDTPLVPYKFLGNHHFSFDSSRIQTLYREMEKLINDSKNGSLSCHEIISLKPKADKISEDLQQLISSSGKLKIELYDCDISIEYAIAFFSGNKFPVFTYIPKWAPLESIEQVENLFEKNNFPAAVTTVDTPDIQLNDKTLRAEISTKMASSEVTPKTQGGKEATVATSEDNQVILNYRDEDGNGTLYISRLYQNEWTAPERVDKPVNTKGWETNECISADGMWLYFTSDREGGMGGVDIYRSKRLPNGEWSAAENLGPEINTAYDDRAPYIFPDGTTLFFSSNGRKSNEFFDIYISNLSDAGTWSTPIDVGYPAKPIDEYPAYSFASENKFSPDLIAELAEQEKMIRKNVNTEKENYLITFLTPPPTFPKFETVEKLSTKQSPITLLRGRVIDTEEKYIPKDIRVTIMDNNSNRTINEYNLKEKKGQFLFILPPGINNNITYRSEGYLFYSKNVDITDKKAKYEANRAIKMAPLRDGSIISLNNIFFDSVQIVLLPVSEVELDNIASMLKMNTGMVVEISDFVVLEKKSKNDKKICEARATAIKQALVARGIKEESIIAKGYIKLKSEQVKEHANYLQKPFSHQIQLKVIENIKDTRNYKATSVRR